MNSMVMAPMPAVVSGPCASSALSLSIEITFASPGCRVKGAAASLFSRDSMTLRLASESIRNWDDTTTPGINQQKVKSSYLQEVNSQADFDSWRGFQQTTDKKYYLGSKDLGLWEMTILSATNPYQKGTRVGADVPALSNINALASTNDGSLFIGTNTGGLYRLTPGKTVEKVAGVPGNKVIQLVYDGSTASGMLLVLTSEGLTVLRGY